MMLVSVMVVGMSAARKRAAAATSSGRPRRVRGRTASSGRTRAFGLVTKPLEASVVGALVAWVIEDVKESVTKHYERDSAADVESSVNKILENQRKPTADAAYEAHERVKRGYGDGRDTQSGYQPPQQENGESHDQGAGAAWPPCHGHLRRGAPVGRWCLVVGGESPGGPGARPGLWWRALRDASRSDPPEEGRGVRRHVRTARIRSRGAEVEELVLHDGC